MRKKVAILVPLHNARRFLPDLLRLLNEQSTSEFDLFAFDNGSSDGTGQMLSEYRNSFSRILNCDRPLGFATACNYLFERTKEYYEYVILLNQDASPQATWLETLLQDADVTGWDMMGSNVVESPPPSGQNTVFCKPIWFVPQLGALVRFDATNQLSECNFAAGTALLLRTSFFARCDHIFDSRLYMYHEDVDLSVRVICSGGRIGISPSSVVVHDHVVEPKVGYLVSRNIHWVLVKNFGVGFYLRTLKEILAQVPDVSSVVSRGVRRHALAGTIVGILGASKFLGETMTTLQIARYLHTIPNDIMQGIIARTTRLEVIYHG